MAKVFITDRIKALTVETDILENHVTLEKNLNAEVLLVWHQGVDKAYIDQFKNLKAIIRYGVGFDKVDIDYAASKGITVSNSPDYCTEEVSNTAIGMILNGTRRISQYNHEAKYYKQGWQENVIKTIERDSNLTVGVVGAGRIGSNVLLKAKALGFKTSFYDPYATAGYEKVLNATRYESLEQLLESCNVISVHVPLTRETRGMINTTFIESMKEGSVLVNTSRGGVLESYDAIEHGLENKTLANVFLDVLPEEPPTAHPLIDKWKANEIGVSERLFINPHSSYYSQAAGIEMRRKAALNALGVIGGGKAQHVVNQELIDGYFQQYGT